MFEQWLTADGNPPPHEHEDEAYLVLEGSIDATVGGEIVHVPAGGFVFGPRRHLAGGQRADPGGGKLDCQGDAIQSAADLADCGPRCAQRVRIPAGPVRPGHKRAWPTRPRGPSACPAPAVPERSAAGPASSPRRRPATGSGWSPGRTRTAGQPLSSAATSATGSA